MSKVKAYKYIKVKETVVKGESITTVYKLEERE